MDIDKFGKTESQSDKTRHNNVSVVISSAITSYARIHIKIKLAILKLGGLLYYSDTDSIVTNKKTPYNLIDSTELGKLKLEYGGFLAEGYFITNKTYYLVTNTFYKETGKRKVFEGYRGIEPLIFDLQSKCRTIHNIP